MEPIDLLWFLTVVGLIYCEAATMMQVKEDDDAILDCFLGKANIEEEIFDWTKDKDKNKKEVFLYAKGSYYGHGQTGQDPHFVGRVFHFPDQLQFGNASIVIRKTKTSDSGTYTCHYPDHQPEIRSSISLTVDPVLKPRPEIEGAAPEPCVTILDQTEDSALLQCEVRGASPKPEVVWKGSDGKILTADDPKVTEREKNKHDVVLHITVTETGNYTCVATQDSIHHRNNRTIFVHLKGDDMEKILLGVMVGCCCLLLLLLVLHYFWRRWRFQCIKRCLRTERRDGDKDFDSPLLKGVVRLVVMAGSDVVLPCSLSTKKKIEPTLLVWKKDDRQVFVYNDGNHDNNACPGEDEQFKGRVSHFPDELINGNASIIIRNTRQSDSGSYTCDFPHIQQKRFHIKVLVEGGVRLVVRAGSDVVLPCSLNNKNIEVAKFVWRKDGRQDVFLYNAGTHYNNGRPGQDEQFKGRVSHFPKELRHGNASIIIRNTGLSDSGSYTCDFPHIHQRFHIELLVEQPLNTEEDTEPGVAPVEPDEAVTVHLQEPTE